MSETQQQEPSIEDILASIRKIITDDDVPAEQQTAAESTAVTASAASEEDVLELTEIVEEETSVPTDEQPTTDPFEAVQVAMQKSEAEASAASSPIATPIEKTPTPSATTSPRTAADTELVSNPAAAAAISSFSKITAQQKASEMAALESISGPPVSGRSLDGIVQEMLRPMLKEWLDNNLPEMVERLVQRELHKMIRLAQDDF